MSRVWQHIDVPLRAFFRKANQPDSMASIIVRFDPVYVVATGGTGMSFTPAPAWEIDGTMFRLDELVKIFVYSWDCCDWHECKGEPVPCPDGEGAAALRPILDGLEQLRTAWQERAGELSALCERMDKIEARMKAAEAELAKPKPVDPAPAAAPPAGDKPGDKPKKS